jgi:hypothetical protein
MNFVQRFTFLFAAPNFDAANVPSIKLHVSCGFIEVGHLPSVGYKFGHWTDVVMVQRSLSTGGTTPARGRQQHGDLISRAAALQSRHRMPIYAHAHRPSTRRRSTARQDSTGRGAKRICARSIWAS